MFSNSRLAFGALALLFLVLNVQNVSSISVMSVDLGSEWMKIAIVSPGVPMEIILNTDSQRKTPMAVAFRDGERFIGDSALSVGVRFPERTFTHFLDLMGKTSLKQEAVQNYLRRFPYHKIVETDQGIAFILKDGGKETQFTPEELLSMLLNKARYYAEVASAHSSSSGQKQVITDIVITVQPYFSQIERRAIKHAASLAGLKVLQLINTNAAFALNYGVFRRKDFNATQPTNILFYDMGSGSTVVSIVSYQLVKTKEHGYAETNPQLTIKGIDYDRYLGGFELQLRLRDHLVKLFAEQSKKSVDEIRANNRAMAKLLKEAGRVKKVLSANSDHRAQVENVMNDIDLKAMVAREEFEGLVADLIDKRVNALLDNVFKSSGYTLDEIDSFIIVGGGTRIPKIQQLLQAYFTRDLSKNVNADDAAALGAAYQAAFLSKGFKVKKFHLKDANLFQINVEFNRETEGGNKKAVSRVLFSRGNGYPQKKVMTFNKHTDDFDFTVVYGDIVPQDSEKRIFQVSLTEIAKIFEKYAANSSVEAKGIKVHFKLDESGLLEMDNAEALFELEYEETLYTDQVDQLKEGLTDAISKIGSTISKMFSSKEGGEESNATEPEVPVPDASDTKESESNATTQANGTSEEDSKAKQQVKVELKKKTLKESIPSTVDVFGQIVITDDALAKSKQKLQSLDEWEANKLKRDHAKNALESFISETKDKLQQEEYSSAATEEEKSAIEAELKVSSDWLEYESDQAEALLFEENLKKLRKITHKVIVRVKQLQERPEVIAALKNMLNISQMFYGNEKNASEEDQIFTEVEMKSLKKIIDETSQWLNDSETEELNLPRHLDPTKLTIPNLAEKISALDREVKYLINKSRLATPKKKKQEEPPKNNTEDPKEEKEVEADKEETNDEAEKVEAEADKIEPSEPEKESLSNSKTEL